MMMHYCSRCKDQGKEKLYRINKDGNASIWLMRHLLTQHPKSDFAKEITKYRQAKWHSLLKEKA